jgi:hypothetical protein
MLNSFKIQLQSVWGWADLKSSNDGQNYETDEYMTFHDALSELQDMVDSLMDDISLYRIVPFNHTQEIDLYC